MKLITLMICILLFSLHCISQTRVIDSLKAALKTEKKDTAKAVLLYKLSYQYQKYKPDSALMLAQTAYTISVAKNFIKGQSRSLEQMAKAFNRLGNYPKALQYYIEELKIEEKQNDPYIIASINLSIALVFNSEKDISKALYYARKADSIAIQMDQSEAASVIPPSSLNKLPRVSLYTSLEMGDIYSNADQLDSALKYTKRCYDAAVKENDKLITGTALNNLGNIYLKAGNTEKALNSYKSSMPYFEALQDYNTLAECKLGLAKAFDKQGLHDSAMYYAREAFTLAANNNFFKHELSASAFLSQLYKQQNNIDSAFSYQQIMITLKDSIDSHERIRELQNLTITEQLRQKEIADLKIEQRHERQQQLQLLAIGIFIPISFLITLFISRRKVHTKLIALSGIFSILLLFEYITLLIHPLIGEKTGHSPVLEIIIFVGIAAIITPTHHRIEHWLMARLTNIHNAHLQKRIKPVEHDAEQENKTEDV